MLKRNIQNYIRFLLKEKFFFFCNIIGLSLGFACFIIIMLYVLNEYNYDSIHKNKKNIYRIVSEHKLENDTGFYTFLDYNTKVIIENDFPEVKEVVGIYGVRRGSNKTYAKSNDKYFEQKVFHLIDKSIFQTLTFQLINGDPNNLLPNSNSLVITESIARKYFNSVDVIDENLTIKDNSDTINYTISGVINDMPLNSTHKFEIIGKLENGKKGIDFSKSFSFDEVLLLLNENCNIADLEKKINKLDKSHFLFATVWYHLQNMEDFYLSSFPFSFNWYEQGNKNTILILLLSGCLILLMACVNHVLLTISLLSKRIKELSIKKILCVSRSELSLQILIESSFMLIIALPISFLLICIARPYFDLLFDKPLNYSLIWNPNYLLWTFGLIVLLIFLSGLFISFKSFRITPLKNLSKTIIKRRYNRLFNSYNLLITFQLIVFVSLLSSALVIYSQGRYIINKGVGFDQSDLLVIQPERYLPHHKIRSFLGELINEGYKATSFGGSSFYGEKTRMAIPRQDGKEGTLVVEVMFVDHNFIPNLGISILEGENFYENIPENYLPVIINEEAVKLLNYKNPVGKTINYGEVTHTIVGVVKDFHIHSLHSKISPLFLNLWPRRTEAIYIKIGGDRTVTKNMIDAKWESFFPDEVMDYSYLEDHAKTYYKKDEQLFRVIILFAIISGIIGSLGLIGMFLFVVKRKEKEIAIKKVCGSSVPNIIFTILKEFLVLVFIANLIGLVFKESLSKILLKNFEYKVDINYLRYTIPFAVSIILIILILGYHAYKASRANPIDAIQNE